MRNRIVDSTWLGRGRHVLLDQVLTCQTTSNRDPFSSTLLPLSRLFLAYSSIHTLALASFHSLDRPLTRSLVHSHVPPNRLFTYPHTHNIEYQVFHSLAHSLRIPNPSLPCFFSLLSSSFTNLLVLSPFSPVPKASTRRSVRSYACARSPSGPYYPHSCDREPADVPPLPRFAVPRRESQLGPPPRPTKLHE